LEMYPGGEKGECFEHALNMRIFAFGGLDDQPRSDLGIFFGELDRALAKVGQLTLVVEQQVIPHRSLSVGQPPVAHALLRATSALLPTPGRAGWRATSHAHSPGGRNSLSPCCQLPAKRR